MLSGMGQYRFGGFEVDPDRRELRRGPVLVDVQPKVLDVIVHLVESRDRVVSRRELLDELWGDAAVSEGVLTTAIHAARTALNDSAARGWAIKTVARRGYRFVAPVVEGASQSSATEKLRSTVESYAPSPREDFVGGAAAIDRITRSFYSASRGEGGILVVTGEAGQGKTRMLDEIERRATGWEAAVAATSCEGREGASAYAPWLDLIHKLIGQSDPGDAIRELGQGLEDLAPLIPSLRDSLPEVSEHKADAPTPSRFRLVESIASYLARSAARRPILLLLDDLQAADHGALRLLSLLAREIRHLPLLMIVTVRDYDGSSDELLAETLAEVARHYPGGRLTMEGLSRDQVGVLVAKLLGSEPPADWVDTIAFRSEGNPFFVREIVSLLQVEGPQPSAGTGGRWATQVPPAVRDVVLRRLHRLTASCQELLAVASVLGREWSSEVLGLLSQAEPGTLVETLTEATQVGFLREVPNETDRYRFVHALLFETIYEALPRPRRKSLHRRAAEILESSGVRPAELLPGILVNHYMRVGDDASYAKASDCAEQAARQAASVNAYDEAAKLYGIALDALERMDVADPSRRCDLLIALGGARLEARIADPRGRDSLIRAAQIAQELGEADSLVRVALALAATGFQTGPRDREIIELLSAALDAIGDQGSKAVRARLMANLAYQRIGVSDHDQARALCDEALVMARESGDDFAVCDALNMRCAVLSGPLYASERIRAADELLRISSRCDHAEIGLFAYRWRMLTALDKGDMDAADRELAAYDAAVDRERIWAGRWYGLTVRAARAIAEARFGSAERMVMEGFAHRRDETTPLVIGTFAAQLFWLRREQGRAAEVQHLREHESPQLVFRVLPMLIDAELGNEERAREALHAVVETEVVGLSVDSSYLYVMSALTETAVALGDDGCARILYEQLLPYAENYVTLFLGCLQLGSVSRYLGRLAVTFGEPGMAGYHFAHAVEANRSIGAHLWVAHSRLDWAMALSGQGRAASIEARELLRPCLADAHERGMKVIARRSAELLDDLRG